MTRTPAEIRDSLIRGTVDYQYFFGPLRQPVPPYGIHASSWDDLAALMPATLNRPGRAVIRA